MRLFRAIQFLSLLSASSLSWRVSACENYTTYDIISPRFAIQDNRPPNCPPCFNCQLDAFQCHQFAECNKYNGKCSCPSGFGGDDCSEPLCGSLPDGKDRTPRQDKYCKCKDGWSGINCNVCETNDACNSMMPEGEGGVCYKEPLVVKENYQICDVTNRKILDQLKEKKPQVTFSCTAKDHTCNFQFWVDQKESFYCSLDTCEWATEVEYGKNTTNYECEHIKCRCIPGRMLCGEDGSIDIGEFLEQDIKGPASFSTISTQGGSDQDGSTFQEPAMNNLIKSVFGDKSIFLQCRAGECLYKTDVPGYKVPVKTINTPLIAGVIAGCGLFIVAVILFIWYLSRRSAYRNYAAIQLSDDSDDENGKLMADHKPAALQFDNVSYYLNGRQILSGIRGIARPGQVTAIMGASGAGKTTFLDILARKNKRGTVQGEFYVNGEKVDDNEYRSVVGFVDQEDTMLPTLTVHETILTSALLRLPRDMSNVVKEQRVFEVEKQLGIYHIKDQIIGSEEGKGRGISGGEKKRVSIACELVTSPSILFLDEPTSGLDAFNAFNVIECLVNLARTYNRTVIFTIHQPRSNIVALFDQLILLAKGRTVYSGSFMGCQPYFDHIGYTCPLGFNIADYLVDLTMHASTARSPEEPLLNADAQADHFRTPSSSLRAVKSVASASNASFENSTTESAQDSTAPRKHIRRQSLRQRQERQLYTRKKTSGVDSPSTPRTDDEDNAMGSLNDSTQQWLRLSRQQNSAPSQTVEDPDHLPPIASGYITDLDVIISSYASSDVAASIRDEIASAVESARQANGSADPTAQQGSGGVHMVGYTRVSLLRQFIILSKRTWKNLYRNPMLMLTHYAIAILLAVLSGYLFYGLTDDIKGFQNRLGLFFFLLALFGFSTLTSLTVFTSERLLFMRERANGYYSPITYFAAKVVFDIIPLRLIPPIIMGVIVYPMVGLIADWPEFLKFMLILVLFNLAAAGICLFIGIVFRDGGVANLIGSLVMLFSLLFAGLLLNHDAIPKAALWLQTLSIFHYGFEALIVNEVTYLTLIDHKYGLDIEVPGASILSAFGFDTLALWRDVTGLAVFSGVFIILAYGAMHFLLVERR
ncbi:ABC transporter [Coccidioides immitis RS]|uniref:ABC transporter n=1 Tax=Coccidioides immitis (strain RS) TaxID=246410 RepID=J3K4L1_COCIM|nr:ABC transporter [Coccidioides immitis RS]EAS29262.3 ABC transporter [Coccidioides immitis RS]